MYVVSFNFSNLLVKYGSMNCHYELIIPNNLKHKYNINIKDEYEIVLFIIF